MTTLFTVGHGAAAANDLLQRLQAAAISVLVDVRIAPGSRKHPHFGRDELAVWLPRAGVDYRWERRLGGFRKVPPASPDTALRNASFRGYATHMRTGEFVAAIDEVLDAAAAAPTTVMCSETLWWRCHRRMIADYVTLVREWDVRHLMPGERFEPHRVTDGARRDGDIVVYDGGGAPLLDISDPR
jgi:uncharacterized protein (DUF488 family)